MNPVLPELTNTEDIPYYVGIGASAGGLEALEDFFRVMPSDTGMVFVVIQHLSPDYKSLMHELLARYTEMDIRVISDAMEAKPNTIYLIPPKKTISIMEGKLFTHEQASRTTLSLPIDAFFRSLANDKGKNSIGVILSGTGSDGTLGIRAIKEAGGMVMVQDESTAKFDGMPKSSIATGLVDYVLAPKKMAEELVSFTKHPIVRKQFSLEDTLAKNVDAFTKVILILRDHCGIDFSYYKKNTIIRRLERRLSINRYTSLEEYLKLLSESQKEKDILHRELLIGVTRFFRDDEVFAALEEKVIPDICQTKSQLRVWSAGCSTGEEAYSLAIMLLRHIDDNHLPCDLKLFATDIDQHALEIAGTGYYPDSIVADIEPDLLKKYFIRKEGGYQVNERVRKLVVFAKHNLLRDPPFSRLDLLVCRNLFIYLKPEMQQKILSMFYYALNPKGYLLMGSSESIGEMSEAFSTVDSKSKIYRPKTEYKPGVDALRPLQTGMNRELLTGRRRPVEEDKKMEELWEKTLEQALPPSIILDENDNIVHIINNVEPFLQFKAGKFSTHVFSHVHADLALFVNSILRRLRTAKSSFVIERISGLERFESPNLELTGRSIQTELRRYVLLGFSFVSQEESTDRFITPKIADLGRDTHILDLERELQLTKESLQATVEELETSNEELQSSNEELIASNEELQSTNEELQSVNEELYTVNNEYQSKIGELLRLNNDLDNLLRNLQLGALYLDRRLCIRRITPVVSEMTHILPTDIGRPIAHITVMPHYPELINDVLYVLDHLVSQSREITDPKGKTWLVQIRPYRTEVNAVEGVLVTFVDISKRKTMETEVRLQRELLEKVLSHSPIAHVLLDASGQITYANSRALAIFGITHEEVQARTYDGSQWEITGENGEVFPSENLPFRVVKETLKPVEGVRHAIKVPGKPRVLLSISGVPVIDAHQEFQGAVFIIEAYDFVLQAKEES